MTVLHGTMSLVTMKNLLSVKTLMNFYNTLPVLILVYACDFLLRLTNIISVVQYKYDVIEETLEQCLI